MSNVCCWRELKQMVEEGNTTSVKRGYKLAHEWPIDCLDYGLRKVKALACVLPQRRICICLADSAFQIGMNCFGTDMKLCVIMGKAGYHWSKDGIDLGFTRFSISITV